MVLTFHWFPSLYSIITLALWAFTDAALITYSQTVKKMRKDNKNVNLLLIIGILLLTQKIIWFFFPEVISWGLSDPAEILFYQTMIFTKTLIPLILDIFLGVALTIYFYNNYYNRSRKVLAGPGLYSIGAAILMFISLIRLVILSIDDMIYYENYTIFIIGFTITRGILFVGLSFLFVYSINIRNTFLILFCGLLCASELVFLFSSIDSIIFEVVYAW